MCYIKIKQVKFQLIKVFYETVAHCIHFRECTKVHSRD